MPGAKARAAAYASLAVWPQLDSPPFQDSILPLNPVFNPRQAVRHGVLSAHPAAVGEGADEADALWALWTMRIDQHEEAEAIVVVAEAYFKQTGRFPEQFENESCQERWAPSPPPMVQSRLPAGRQSG